MADGLVIIPTYNEIENIEAIIRAVFELPKAYDILIVDDLMVDLNRREVYGRPGIATPVGIPRAAPPGAAQRQDRVGDGLYPWLQMGVGQAICIYF